jgi:hypothetical protein
MTERDPTIFYHHMLDYAREAVTLVQGKTRADLIDSGCFFPLLQRVREEAWRLGVEGKGKHRDFQGPVEQIWPDIEDTYFEWCKGRVPEYKRAWRDRN